MKKAKTRVVEDDMLPEYDFSGAVRGKYYERFRQGSNVVVLDPDVSKAFPDAASVNEALRTLLTARKSIAVARRVSAPSRPPSERTKRTSSVKTRRRGSSR